MIKITNTICKHLPYSIYINKYRPDGDYFFSDLSYI